MKKEFNNLKNVNSCKNINTACFKSDLIIIHTEWNEFKLINFKKIVKKNKFIVYDMRNIYTPSKMRKNGIKYFGIGR
jgi:UDPglucose 6-dehydrogenase